jgi:hypothetical protein
MSEEDTCYKCGEPIHPSEPVRHGYGGRSHESARCIWLLQEKAKREYVRGLETAAEEMGKVLSAIRAMLIALR